MSYVRQRLFHGDNTGSNPVGDAINSFPYKRSSVGPRECGLFLASLQDTKVRSRQESAQRRPDHYFPMTCFERILRRVTLLLSGRPLPARSPSEDQCVSHPSKSGTKVWRLLKTIAPSADSRSLPKLLATCPRAARECHALRGIETNPAHSGQDNHLARITDRAVFERPGVDLHDLPEEVS